MTTWQDKLVALFIPDIKPVVIAYDDDKLLTEGTIIASLREKGFDVVLSSGLVQIRFEFEKYLDEMSKGEVNKTLLIIHQEESEFSIPYDVTKNAIIIKVSFDDLFPHLSTAVLRLLTTEQINDVYEAYEDEKPSDHLGRDRTCLFLLKNLFRIHPQELKTDNDLIAMLIKLHFEAIKIPVTLGDYFCHYMQEKGRYRNWQNLSALLTDSSYFWNYMQKAWENTLFDKNMPTAGPSKIDFTRSNIAVYIDDVFEMGLMQIKEVSSSAIKPDLIPEKLFELSKNHDSKEKLKQERSKKLLRFLSSEIPSENGSFVAWAIYQKAYSEYMYLNFDKDNSTIFNISNPVFFNWIRKYYDALSFESNDTPIIMPKIIDYLKRKKNHGTKRLALIVMDGMSYSQWLTIKECLPDNGRIVFDEKTMVACIPTLTSVSRQAIFSGLYPNFFSSSVLKTSEEPKLWKKAWDDICTPLYLKTNGTNKADDVLNEITPSNQVVGIVINTIDDLMHKTILGSKEIYERIRIWMGDSFLSNLILGLLDKGYEIWITSDHGNIEASGVGSIKVGNLAETKGARAYIMPSEELRNQIVDENEYAIPWDSNLLPNDNFSVLLAKDNYAFISKNSKEISHGGISIDEVMVPFVHVYRKDK